MLANTNDHINYNTGEKISHGEWLSLSSAKRHLFGQIAKDQQPKPNYERLEEMLDRSDNFPIQSEVAEADLKALQGEPEIYHQAITTAGDKPITQQDIISAFNRGWDEAMQTGGTHYVVPVNLVDEWCNGMSIKQLIYNIQNCPQIVKPKK